MKLSTSVKVHAPKEEVWAVITDWDKTADVISGITDLTVLERPESGLTGLKWKETRIMFGKEATETMWIVDAQPNDYYKVRAESHGSVYLSGMSVQDSEEGCELTMSFEAQPQTFMAKVMGVLMGGFMRKSVMKACHQDLLDIKAYVESRN
jgi:carbon monoxide dehydrogenase subunit G